MNILMVGNGSGGSWQMRGVQIGQALGARVTNMPTTQDWQWADVCILVKRAIGWGKSAHRFQVPIIWDVLDCWEQPEQNSWTVEQGKELIARLAADLKPAAMIAATQQMAEDIGGVYIPHHCRIGLNPTPPREHVKVVGYDGQRKYLGRWLNAIKAECDRRGWQFVIHPDDLSQVDILVAFRDGKWDGPLCRAWKSGVKYTNAICAGRPILTQPCAAFSEMNPVGHYIEDPEWLASNMNIAESMRDVAFDEALSAAWTNSVIVHRYYRPLLERVASRVAA